MRETLQQFRKAHRSLGVFASSEYHHDENWVDIFTTREKKIHGESLSSAISRWYFKREQVVLVQDGCERCWAGPRPAPEAPPRTTNACMALDVVSANTKQCIGLLLWMH